MLNKAALPAAIRDVSVINSFCVAVQLSIQDVVMESLIQYVDDLFPSKFPVVTKKGHLLLKDPVIGWTVGLLGFEHFTLLCH